MSKANRPDMLVIDDPIEATTAEAEAESVVEVAEAMPKCRINAMGHYVPESKIAALDLLRDDVVVKLIEEAKAEQERVTAFKIHAFAEVAELVNVAAEQYDAKMGGSEGNLTLVSFCGKYKVQRQISKQMMFDERLQVAKSLIDECIHEWSKDSNDNIKALVEHAFDTDQEGKLNISRIFGLLKLKITDKGWVSAMEAIKDSIQFSGSKTYLRFYQKDVDGNWKGINIDMRGT